MRIDSMENAIATAEPPKKQGKKGSNGFEQLLNEADKRDSGVVERRERPQEKKNNVESKKDNSNEPKETTVKNEKNDIDQKTEKLEKPEELTAAEEVEPTLDLLNVPDDVVIAFLAETLQVPPETVVQWLGALQLTPADLTETNAVVKLLQEAFGKETPTALLTEPKFPAAFKAINEAMEQFKAPQEASVVNLTAKIAVPENLTVQTEDNKVVVAQVVNTTQQTTSKLNTSNTEQLPTVEQAIDDEVELLQTQQTQTVTATSSDNRARGRSNMFAQTEAPQTVVVDEEIETQAAAAGGIAEVTLNARIQQVLTAPRTAAATAQAPLDPQEVINQIMNYVRVAPAEQFAELRIHLRPESLGDLTLRVLTQNGIVTAQFTAESQRVRETLESNFNLLRDALEEQGLQFSELSVSVRQEGGENAERMNQFAQGQQERFQREQRVTELSLEDDAANLADPSELLEGTYDYTV